MSETATQPEPNCDDGRDVLVNPLIPIFMEYTGGDPVRAHRAAVNAINSYRFRSIGEMISVVQIIALALASIRALGLSMTSDVPLPLAARFQTNATALIKSEQTVRRVLRTPPPEQRLPERAQPKPRPEGGASPPQPEPKTQSQAQPHPKPQKPQPEPTASPGPETAAFAAFVQGTTQQLPNPRFMKPSPPMGIRAAALSSSATNLLTAAPPTSTSVATGRGGG